MSAAQRHSPPSSRVIKSYITATETWSSITESVCDHIRRQGILKDWVYLKRTVAVSPGHLLKSTCKVFEKLSVPYVFWGELVLFQTEHFICYSTYCAIRKDNRELHDMLVTFQFNYIYISNSFIFRWMILHVTFSFYVEWMFDWKRLNIKKDFY